VSEHDSAFFRTFTLVLVFLGVFMAVIIFLANTLTQTDTASSDARVQAQINEVIKPVGEVATTASAPAAAPAAGGAVDGKATYQSACFACHGTGAAGAPKAGDKAAWGPRIKKGAATLHEHALKGFQGKSGVMPAKGGNAGLSDEAVKAAVDYMVSLAK